MADKVLRPTIGNLWSLGNFSQTFRWLVNFENFPKAMGSKWKAADINFRAESMSIPELEVETTEVQIRGNKVRQPGIGTYNSPITLTLVETIDGYVMDFIAKWQELCWTTTKNYSGGSTQSPGQTEYKTNLCCKISLTLLDNKDSGYYQYLMYNCHLASATKGDPDSSSADPFKPQLSLAYDYFEPKALTDESPAINSLSQGPLHGSAAQASNL